MHATVLIIWRASDRTSFVRTASMSRTVELGSLAGTGGRMTVCGRHGKQSLTPCCLLLVRST